jgi:hypothetical protein
MALADPAVISYSGVSVNVPLNGRDIDESTYRVVQAGNVVYTLGVKHDFSKRCAASVRLTREAPVTDPVTGQTVMESASVSVAANFSKLHTPSQAQLLYDALCSFLSSAVFLKIAGGET